MDWFLYSGDLESGYDFDFIQLVAKEQKSDKITLVLCTNGGSPDAAYKIGRYLQSQYKNVKIFIPGVCKSAGTLLAIAANKIIFSPYGEIGPLDIQMTQTDKIMPESGLNFREAFLSFEDGAKKTFHQLITEITSNSEGSVSFRTAADSASKVVSALFGPIFSRIDIEEVGTRMRAMEIAESYGERLDEKFKNLREDALGYLSWGYASHSFVIDIKEARKLFYSVRKATKSEQKLVEYVDGDYDDKYVDVWCQIPESGHPPKIVNVTETYNYLKKNQRSTYERTKTNRGKSNKNTRQTKA